MCHELDHLNITNSTSHWHLLLRNREHPYGKQLCVTNSMIWISRTQQVIWRLPRTIVSHWHQLLRNREYTYGKHLCAMTHHSILSKEPCILSKEPHILSKSRVFCQKSPIFCQKSQVFCPSLHCTAHNCLHCTVCAASHYNTPATRCNALTHASQILLLKNHELNTSESLTYSTFARGSSEADIYVCIYILDIFLISDFFRVCTTKTFCMYYQDNLCEYKVWVIQLTNTVKILLQSWWLYADMYVVYVFSITSIAHDTAMYCNTMQRSATHCTARQHTVYM